MTVLFLFIVLTSIAFSSQAQNLTCSAHDIEALKAFVGLLESDVDGWDFNSSCCHWPGITCSSPPSAMAAARVVELDLSCKRLFGELSESLGNLEHLKTLNLSHNFLKGPIPLSILHLPHLEILDLSYNELSGLFSGSINLPSIRVFNVSDNSIGGGVPVGICRNSTGIKVLNVVDNFLNGVVPLGLGNCTSLEELGLAKNLLNGALPQDLFVLRNLKKLFLQENNFDGQLNPLIGNLSNLVRLDISMNEFSGNFPDVFDRFVQLSYFSAQSNILSGEIPNSLANSPSITWLSLRNNSLGGAINLNCSAMVNLGYLDLATNEFKGMIPENLSSCPRLSMINLAKNNLQGQIPETFKDFQSLTSISLSNSSISNLTTALQILQHCRNLTTLVLTLNFGGEVMPASPSFEFVELKTLVIANCRLTGSIPQWLSGCRNLQLLDLSWNNLGGSIPPWFGNFSSLFYLDLSNNSLTGNLPKELTEMRSFISGNMSTVEPSPDFPLFVRKNQSRKGFKYRRPVSFPPTLDLGNNFLTGPILPEFGNLKRLHVLDLKCNNLSGSIPDTLSQLSSLETLDLSFNNLSGTIPHSLSNLSFLSNFNVAHNDLSGSIPTGAQFQSFPNSSFEGNPGLCGGHGYHLCSVKEDPSGKSGLKHEKSKRRVIAIAVGVGIGAGTIILAALVYLVVLCSCKRKAEDPENEDADTADKNLEEISSLVILCQNKENNIVLDDLLKATDGFDESNIIGCGGFGLVYKAILPDGRKVAIKRLSGEYFQVEREFQAEIETLSRAQHPNLVPFLGHCKYKNDRLLIYTFMENGSLDYWLHEKTDGPSSLNWETRLRIARGSARGLAYLHQSCVPHILHRDIKSSNILLDEKFEAHLADFGLARLILPNVTHVTTDLVGTLGYIPPEYGQASVASYKGDVYSFGVVLLELLTGKRPMDMCRPKACRDMIAWVKQMKRENRETEVLDPLIYDKEYVHEMVNMLNIACLCLNENPKTRPCTLKLVSWLDNIDSVS